MFADDCISFCRTTRVAIRNVKHILDGYKVSRQLVNLHKSKFNCQKEFPMSIKNNVYLQANSLNTIRTYLDCSIIDRKKIRTKGVLMISNGNLDKI